MASRSVENPHIEDPSEPTDFDVLEDAEKVFHLEDLKRRSGSSGGFSPPPVSSRSGMQILSTEELLLRPEQKWIVEGLIPELGLTLLIGRNQVGKSFLALDLAAALSLGRPWLGRATTPTNVLYAAIEVIDNARVSAWQDHHKVGSLPGLKWFVGSVNLKNRAHQDDLIAAVRDSSIELLVLDTLNRAISGFDENGSADMGLIIALADRLRLDADCGLLVVHHTPRTENNPRGHTSLEDAADTILTVTEKSGRRVLSVTKQRNAPSGLTLTFRVVGHPKGGAYITAVDPASDLDQHTASEQSLVQALVQNPSVLPGTHKDLKEMAVGELRMGVSTFGNALNGLVDNGILAKDGEGKGTLYEWTKAGEKLVNSL
jgi:hypothetical protein